MMPTALIGYLAGFDSRNIFWIWVSSKDKVIRSRDGKTGSVSWPVVLIRPDKTWGISELSKYLQNPGSQYMAVINLLLEYLSATKYFALQCDGNTPPNIGIGYSDASIADEVYTRHRSHGYILSLYGGLITWKAQKQKTVTTSFTESELLALQ